MFQALFFQERDARGDLKAHKTVPPAAPMSPKIGGARASPHATVHKHPTTSHLIGGKGLFLNMHGDKQ
jgi:hypothetical protein